MDGDHDFDIVAKARLIATAAHEGQTDKTGRPYIEHPAAIAATLDLPAQQAVAWLHDVVEDTDVTLEDLHAAGIPDEIVEAVEAITHRKGEANRDYWRRVAANAHAVAVKRKDIGHNLRPDRLAQLDEATQTRLAAKYAEALAALDEFEAESRHG